MSEEIRTTEPERKLSVKPKQNGSDKPVTSTAALILVMLVEFIMFAFYPFVFLVIIPYRNYEPYPENYCDYHNGEKKVVLTENVRFSSYVNWETEERGDGSNILLVPKGSTIEVAQVHMHDYPEEEAYISISFYYDKDGTGYTLWGGIDLKWIENPEEIIRDLDAIREAEAKNNRDVKTKTLVGFVITIAVAAFAVFLVYMIFKKNLARHVVFASFLVMVVYVLLFVLGPIGSKIYYSNFR